MVWSVPSSEIYKKSKSRAYTIEAIYHFALLRKISNLPGFYVMCEITLILVKKTFNIILCVFINM